MTLLIRLNCVLFIVLLAVAAPAAKRPSTGADGVIDTPEKTVCLAGRTYDDIKHCVKYIELDNMHIVETMTKDGRITQLEDDTAIHVLAYRNNFIKVRLKDGENKGKIVWIPLKWGDFSDQDDASSTPQQQQRTRTIKAPGDAPGTKMPGSAPVQSLQQKRRDSRSARESRRTSPRTEDEGQQQPAPPEPGENAQPLIP